MNILIVILNVPIMALEVPIIYIIFIFISIILFAEAEILQYDIKFDTML